VGWVCKRPPADLAWRHGRAAAGGAECGARLELRGLCSGVPARLPCSADCISATCMRHPVSRICQCIVLGSLLNCFRQQLPLLMRLQRLAGSAGGAAPSIASLNIGLSRQLLAQTQQERVCSAACAVLMLRTASTHSIMPCSQPLLSHSLRSTAPATAACTLAWRRCSILPTEHGVLVLNYSLKSGAT
jgi:hypothetical protein